MNNKYYNEKTICYLDGAYVLASEAKTDLYSQTLHYGLGAFEGIKSYQLADGSVNIFKGKEHYDRLQQSCKAAGIPYQWSSEELVEITHEVLRRNNLTNAYIRPLVFCPANMSLSKPEAASLVITAWHWAAYLGENLLNVMISSYERPNPKAFLIETKIAGNYVNSILACQEAKSKGFDEAVLLDMQGYVAEAPGANVFMEKDGKLFTAPKGHIFPGITRNTVFEICEKLGIQVEQKHFTADEFRQADSAFFCGTAAEIVGVASIDKHILPVAWKNSLGNLIQKAYSAKVLEVSTTNHFQLA